jgi:hypothetical protein
MILSDGVVRTKGTRLFGASFGRFRDRLGAKGIMMGMLLYKNMGIC